MAKKAEPKKQVTPEEGEGEARYGEIVGRLLSSGIVTGDQVAYADRVHKKLEEETPLLSVISELGYTTDEQIQNVILEHRVSMKIGSLLVELGYISQADLETAFRIQAEDDRPRKLGEILTQHNFISERKLLKTLSLQLGFPFVEPEFLDINPQLVAKFPPKMYDTHQLIPIQREEGGILVAFADPMDPRDMEAAKQTFGNDIIPAIARPDAIRETVIKFRRETGGHVISTSMIEGSIVNIADQLIENAIEENVSDIHIEPLADRLRIRYRQDGVLNRYKDYPLEIIAPLTSRIKVMCGVDITEKRRHQGGRLLFDYHNVQYDLRVSFYITLHGEKIVLRLLNRQGELLKIEEIGMAPRMLKRFMEDALEVPSGVILITGPTGSGKTTSVYSCINHINTPQTSIITAEEPVEYVIGGIAQCSINPSINLTFEETLRHIVRQDPDVIVIGEIRDNYSAQVAVQAALTGHKVLTTFHTEDSIGGLIRLLNMDIEAFLISSTVVCVVAQRLIRRVCSHCAQPYTPTSTDLQRLGYRPEDTLKTRFMSGKGCDKCKHTGYRGRIGVFESLVLNEMVRNAILERKSSHEIRRICIESSGLMTLLEDGVIKASKGYTTLKEVFRCLPRVLQPRSIDELKRLSGY